MTLLMSDFDPQTRQSAPSRNRLRKALRHVVLVLTLRCEEADLIRLKAGHGDAIWAEVLAERLHRSYCGTCRRSRRQAQAVDMTLSVFAERETAVRR